MGGEDLAVEQQQGRGDRDREDGTDQGGDASPPGRYQSLGWQKGRDLVWPGPATAEEISAYRQKQASNRGR